MLQDLHHLCGPALDKVLQRSLTKAELRRRITSFISVTIFSLMESRRLLTFLIQACCLLMVGLLSTRSHRSFSIELLPQTYAGYSSLLEDLAFSFCLTSWDSSLLSSGTCQVHSEWKHKQLEKDIPPSFVQAENDCSHTYVQITLNYFMLFGHFYLIYLVSRISGVTMEDEDPSDK